MSGHLFLTRRINTIMADIKTDYSDVKFADNGKLKLLIIVGTRPEIIRLAAVITKCRKYFDTVLAAYRSEL